jgi:hypothetical protein
MDDYWHNRYLRALSLREQAQSSGIRSAYGDLADHYKAMREFCERSSATVACRATAWS